MLSPAKGTFLPVCSLGTLECALMEIPLQEWSNSGNTEILSIQDKTNLFCTEKLLKRFFKTEKFQICDMYRYRTQPICLYRSQYTERKHPSDFVL